MEVTEKYKTLLNQLLRYAVVGVASNLAGYLLYLLVTYLWLPPKQAMTLLYAVGATVGYVGNRRLTFSYRDGVAASALRYSIAHLGGYFFNLALLLIFVDRLGYSHQLVQAIAIFLVAPYLFLAFKYYVFPATTQK
ncbi:GtrA family protein [Roseobacter sp. S98]|uniref:GtrA family protein n=1 Tax=Roseobacter algicola (ex Choi et al. 2025) (nom. illeg.) TaxID=3092138 RepID=UPI0035C6A58E